MSIHHPSTHVGTPSYTAAANTEIHRPANTTFDKAIISGVRRQRGWLRVVKWLVTCLVLFATYDYVPLLVLIGSISSPSFIQTDSDHWPRFLFILAHLIRYSIRLLRHYNFIVSPKRSWPQGSRVIYDDAIWAEGEDEDGNGEKAIEDIGEEDGNKDVENFGKEDFYSVVFEGGETKIGKGEGTAEQESSVPDPIV